MKSPRCVLLASVLAASVPAQTVLASWAVSGCSPVPDLLVMYPVTTGLDFAASPLLQWPLVLVLGLGSSPTLLPGIGAVPCLLLPSPDVLLLLAPAQAFTLPIPAGTPPVTVWVQGVEVQPFQLLTSHGFQVVVS